MDSKELFYGIKNQINLSSSLENLYIEKSLTGVVEVFVWKRAEISLCIDSFLENIYHPLTEDYGDPDGDIVEPVKSVEALAEKLIKEIKKTFNVWACEPTGESFFYDFDKGERVGR